MEAEQKPRLSRKIRDAAEAAIIGTAVDFGQDRVVAGDSGALAEAAVAAAYPLIEREVCRRMAREILHLHHVNRQCSGNAGPWGSMDISLRRIERGEALPDWRELRGGEGAEHG